MSELRKRRHVWLYAKERYKQSDDLLGDLKIIVGHVTSIGPEYVSERNIFDVIFDEVAPTILNSGNPPLSLKKMVLGLYAKSNDSGEPLNAVMLFEELLHVLKLASVIEDDQVIIDLGEPDFTLLPAP